MQAFLMNNCSLHSHSWITEPTLCRKVPELYKESFLDYLITPGNGMKQITLSSLNLEKVDKIIGPLTGLAKAFVDSKSDSRLVEAIIAARRGSRDFVLGIFVDLRDFCEKLEKGLDAGSLTKTPAAGGPLAAACKKLSDAINISWCRRMCYRQSSRTERNRG